jgi:hypothetical protein
MRKGHSMGSKSRFYPPWGSELTPQKVKNRMLTLKPGRPLHLFALINTQMATSPGNRIREPRASTGRTSQGNNTHYDTGDMLQMGLG